MKDKFNSQFKKNLGNLNYSFATKSPGHTASPMRRDGVWLKSRNNPGGIHFLNFAQTKQCLQNKNKSIIFV